MAFMIFGVSSNETIRIVRMLDQGPHGHKFCLSSRDVPYCHTIIAALNQCVRENKLTIAIPTCGFC
jgi:hypothetical protein